MQHLEHDMDDLFRKAADDYPLKENENKWETIASRLSDESYSETSREKKGKRRKYILSALLLLLFLVTGFFLFKNIDNRNTVAENKNLQIDKSADAKHSAIEKNNAPKNKNEFLKTKNSTPIAISNDNINPISSKALKRDQKQEDQIGENNFVKKDNYEFDRLNVLHDFSLRKEFQKIHITHLTVSTRTLPAITYDPIGSENSIPKNRGIYWGFTAGPQLNEVKSQGMNKTGFDLGGLLGYRFSKKISVETGFHFATKNYYSDGKYFKMAPDPSMPPNMTLMSLKGNSKIIEIPLKLKYDFINNGRNNLFSAAGITSYLLTKETNNYHAMVNGNPQDMDKTYSDVTNYTAATFYFSAGYEHRILKRNKIRIEPYLQIPLKGIGVGKMPVTSTGLHLGITWERK